MKEFLIGFAIGAVVLLLLYFFYHKPALENSYQEGRNSIFVKEPFISFGEPQIEYRDTTIWIYDKKPVERLLDTLKTNLDTLMISQGDSLWIKAEVTIIDSIADWFLNIEHRHMETFRVDTLRYFIKDIEYFDIPRTFFDDVKEASFWILIGQFLIGLALLIF